MKSNMKFFNNDEGVSPVIATLVLIVVAIIGAAAVGLIVSGFSSNVANQANSGNTASQASTQLTVAGSTSMYPVITELGAWYNTNQTGVKVIVNPGGSGVGYMSVEQGMADVGMISEHCEAAQLTQYPNLQEFQVGASGVVFATSGPATAGITTGQLDTLFSLGAGVVDAAPQDTFVASVGRSDVSGTQDTADAFLTANGLTSWSPSFLENGNGGVKTELVANPTYIGILDSDYCFGTTGVNAVPVIVGTTTYTPTWSNIQTEIENAPTAATYPAGLIRPLNLITNGAPSPIAHGFISFCQQPNAAIEGAFASGYQVQIAQVNSNFIEGAV
jgi:phosphate transport system substrate-binding protein